MIVKPTVGYNPYPLFAGGTCEGCPLFCHKVDLNSHDPRAFSLPEIGVKGGVLVLGEALGSTEAKVGAPFKGQAGAEVNRVFYRLKRERKEANIWNVIGCQPPFNRLSGQPYEADAIAHCDFYFKRVMQAVKPSVVLAVGATAMRKVLGSEYCEVREPVKQLRGYVYQRALVLGDKLHRFYVVPTYHPAFIMRGQQDLHWVVLQDFHKAFDIAQNGWSTITPEYIEQPSPSQVEQFITQCKQGGVIAVDIETPRSAVEPNEELYRHFDDIHITDVSFSIKEGTAITMKMERYSEAIRAVLSLPFEYSVWWNGLDFDIPRLRGKGFHIESEPLDAMWLWHYTQPDIPKALGYVSSLLTSMPEWKTQHNSRPEWYSCCDADATIRCFNEMKRLLLREGRWDSYLKDGHKMLGLLDEIGLKGVPFDEAQHNRFRAVVEERLEKTNAELQKVVPILCKPFESKKTLMVSSPCRKCFGKGYKVEAAKVRLLGLRVKNLLLEHSELDIYGSTLCAACKGSTIKDYQHSAYTTPEGSEYDGYVVRRLSDAVVVWFKEKDFLYNGDTQVMNYIRWSGHSAKSTDEDELKRLIRLYKDDLVYPLVLECRKLSKLKGQYGKGIRSSPDGTLKTKFTLRPATGRLASEQLIQDKEGCNVQNIPKRSNEYIDSGMIVALRNSIVAPRGSVLVGVDYRAIEAVLAGWFARDDNYVAAAKLGIHAIMTSVMLKHPINPLDPDAPEKIAKIKQNHKRLYDTNKILVHMSTYLGTPYKLVRQFPEHFPTMAAAQRHQNLFFRTLAKKLRQWQLETMQLAHRQHYLENPFGYRRYFWDVIGKDGKLGTQAREAVCTLPQGTAGAVIRRAMLSLPPYLRDCLRWQIHDELLFILPVECYKEWTVDIMAVMTRPIPQLDGLVIDVEAEVGEKWGEMEGFNE